MERRRKILLVITKSNWGGAQRYVYDLATNLDQNKFEVAVALGGDGPLKQKLNSLGIRIISLDRLERDVNITNDFRVLLNLISLFKSERPDVIHLNSSKIGGLGGVAGRLTGVSKIIFTAHGWAFNEDRDAFSKLVIKFFAWLTIIFNHKVIAVSKNIKEQVRNWPFVSSKIEVIYSGLGKIDFKAREEARALLLGPEFPENKLLTGNIAELHPIKGQKYLIEALALLKETDFTSVIIGEGEERENLEKLINQNNLENKVKLVGHIDQAPTYLKAFDIFVFPSLSEALGYAALEAGAAGLPVIASRVGGIPEIIDNLESGLLIAPRRPDEIKNALLYLINHREERKKFGENLQKKVTEKFSLKRMVQETKKLYLED